MFRRKPLSVLIEMLIKDRTLRQIDHDYLRALDHDTLLAVSMKLTDDLKAAREQLRRSSRNSSMPPSSERPWAGKPSHDDEPERDEEPPAQRESSAASADGVAEETPSSPDVPPESSTPSAVSSAPSPSTGEETLRRKAGKQPGAKGYGRSQRLSVTAIEHHHVHRCALCERSAPANGVGQTAWTGFYVLDLELRHTGQAGLSVTNTLHRYYRWRCPCGQENHSEPQRSAEDALWSNTGLSQWRLVGPTLAAFIVALSLRGRLSRAQTQEFLRDWLGIALSIGCIAQCIVEAGRASESVERELIAGIREAELAHADETSHPEHGQVLWLWVFASASTVLYYIAHRNQEMVEHLLIEEGFGGWLMSDGYSVYRRYARRLRCWAHLLRKAVGLQESLDRRAQVFGREVHRALSALIEAVYAARGSPSAQPSLSAQHAERLTALRAHCERARASSHAKTHALGVELLNDWAAIFAVLDHPRLPLTNNEAERLLRHWVIARRISHGTRSAAGSRAFALLASVIETCRRRAQSPWRYLADVIAAARAGAATPALPPMLAPPSAA